MSREERMHKSNAARIKRSKVKETVETIEKRKRADVKNLKKKINKLKRRHHDGK
jgi:hypothetical protein